jgi:hypothetical protein
MKSFRNVLAQPVTVIAHHFCLWQMDSLSFPTIFVDGKWNTPPTDIQEEQRRIINLLLMLIGYQ